MEGSGPTDRRGLVETLNEAITESRAAREAAERTGAELATERHWRRRAAVLSAVLAAVLIVGLVLSVTLIVLVRESIEKTHAAVAAQVPGLQAQIRQRDQTIADQQDELAQAVAAIKQEATLLISHGIQPPEITISPPKH